MVATRLWQNDLQNNRQIIDRTAGPGLKEEKAYGISFNGSQK